MWSNIEKAVLRKLVKNSCHGNIPRSGKKALSVDRFTIYIKDGDNWALLIKEIDENSFAGSYWDGSKFSLEASIPHSLARNLSFEINHYYKQFDFTYKSILSYILVGASGLDYLRAYTDKIKQFWFNKRELVLSDRIDILKLLVDETISNKDYEFDEFSIPNHMHGLRWFLHPDQSRQQRYYKLLLESLESSGDIGNGKHRYILTGKALETISKYEGEERKHQEVMSQSKAIKWITAALIAVGLIQAAVTFFKSS